MLVQPSSDLPESITAPVEKGTLVGTAKVMYADMELGTIELVVGETVDESFLLRALNSIQNVMKSTWFKIIFIILLVLIFLYICFTMIYNKKAKKKKRSKALQKKASNRRF